MFDHIMWLVPGFGSRLCSRLACKKPGTDRRGGPEGQAEEGRGLGAAMSQGAAQPSCPGPPHAGRPPGAFSNGAVPGLRLGGQRISNTGLGVRLFPAPPSPQDGRESQPRMEEAVLVSPSRSPVGLRRDRPVLSPAGVAGHAAPDWDRSSGGHGWVGRRGGLGRAGRRFPGSASPKAPPRAKSLLLFSLAVTEKEVQQW